MGWEWPNRQLKVVAKKCSLQNSLQEMDIGKTVDISVDAGEPTRRPTWHFSERIGCGGDGANRTAGVGQLVRQVCKYAL